MEEKKLSNTQTFFKSFINNRVLFERRKNSIIYPLLILVLIISILAIPSYFLNMSIDSKSLMKNFPQIEEPMGQLLTSSLDCSISNAKLVCSDDTQTYREEFGDEIVYTVIVTNKAVATDTEIVYNSPKKTDNLIILLPQYIRIRYAQRDHVNEKVNVYEILGDYTTLEGFSFKEMANKIEENPDSLQSEISDFILTAYKSTLDTQLIVDLANSILSFLLLVIVSCVILKGAYVFKLKKGFKFSECFKISLTSSLPSIVISLIASLFFGFSAFATIFGFLFVGRIIFIYFKYIFNSRIFKEIYEQDKEERFNV